MLWSDENKTDIFRQTAKRTVWSKSNTTNHPENYPQCEPCRWQHHFFPAGTEKSCWEDEWSQTPSNSGSKHVVNNLQKSRDWDRDLHSSKIKHKAKDIYCNFLLLL